MWSTRAGKLETLERYVLSHALNHELSNECVESQLSTYDACVTLDASVTSHACTYSACECAAAMAMSLAVVVLCMVFVSFLILANLQPVTDILILSCDREHT